MMPIKSKPNLFMVNTPHQLLNAIEAVHALRLTNNHLLVVKPRNGVLDRFMPMLGGGDWATVNFLAISIEPKFHFQSLLHPSVNRWYARYVRFRKMYAMARLAAKYKHVDNLLLGHYSAEWTPFMRHLANSITYDALCLLDDGTDTIEINESRHKYESAEPKGPTDKGASRMSFWGELEKRFWGKWRKWNLAEAPSVTFFTIYDLDVQKNDRLIMNHYSYLQSMAPPKSTYLRDTVVFLGQCTVDEYIDIKDHLGFLSSVRRYFSDKKIIYVAHPRDSAGHVAQIIEHLQCEIWPSSSTIEYDLIVRGVKPAIVAGFISSALITLAHLMSADVSVICFHIAPEHWIHWREDAIGAYEYIKRKEEKRISVVPLSLQEDNCAMQHLPLT
jgi:hypothetical protein